MSVLVRTFLAAAGLRALRDAAHTALVVLSATSTPVDILHLDWKAALGLVGGSALLSLVKSVSGIAVGTSETSPAAVAVAAHQAAQNAA